MIKVVPFWTVSKQIIDMLIQETFAVGLQCSKVFSRHRLGLSRLTKMFFSYEAYILDEKWINTIHKKIHIEC